MAHGEPSALLLDYTQDKVAMLDESGTYTYANAATEHVLGFGPDELVGDSAFGYVHPDDRADVRDRFERVVDTESGFAEATATYRHRASDGSWVWLESRLSNLTDDELSGYVVSSRVVTDRVEAERERRETQERLAELADTTDDVLWLFDGDWEELLFCNPAYESLFGRPVEELEGDPQSFLACIYPPDRPVVESAMERLSAGHPTDQEIRVNPSTDYSRWVWVQGEPIVRDGEVVRIAGFSRDVTDRRRRERQLVVLDTFLRHNVRNQLNVVLGNAEALQQEIDADREKRTAMIRRAGETLLETAEKQRAIVDVITGATQTRPKPLDETVRDAVAPLRERFPAATIHVDVGTEVTVEAPDGLRCAVAELVENGIRHAGTEQATVTVRVRVADDRVRLSVADDAPPIPEYDRNVLLGDHEMSTVNHSRGCGLWLVYWVVDLAGGHIDHSADDGGNVVTLTLPRGR